LPGGVRAGHHASGFVARRLAPGGLADSRQELLWGNARAAIRDRRESPGSDTALTAPTRSTAATVKEALAALDKASTRKDHDNLARFGITAKKAYGVSMANIQKLGKRFGRDHEFALALWKTGWYEARMLCAFVDEPAKVTAAQMDKWCRDFDNWGIADTLCFCLFDRTPHAWAMVTKWSSRKPEFERRASFALLASLAGHDKAATDQQFLKGLTLIEKASTDGRNFVKKALLWALRRIGGRSKPLHAATINVCKRMMASTDASAVWLGRNALRELERRG
jgi:3-methyladenine DNA glycosylase AlkD